MTAIKKFNPNHIKDLDRNGVAKFIIKDGIIKGVKVKSKKKRNRVKVVDYPIKVQMKTILKSGEPRLNDEWSNGKYDIKDVIKLMSRLLQAKMQQAYMAGARVGDIKSITFDRWMLEEGIQKVDDALIYK